MIIIGMILQKNILILILISNYILFAKDSFPEGWPWKGVDTMAYVIDTDPKALQFIIDNKIKYVRIHFFKKKVMKDYDVNADEALELNLNWAKTINDKLTLHGIRSFITLADFPVSLKACIDKRKSAYWKNKSCIDQIYHDVNKTVSYFKNSNILGYEFLGEPVVVKHGKSFQPENWNNIFKNIIMITRKIDKIKWLFYSPGPWGLPKGYNEVIPFNDSKIIYNAHMYNPHRYTHQNVRHNKNSYVYPGWIHYKYWDKDALQKNLTPLIKFQEKYNKPVAISEFSTALWAEDSNRYLADLIEIFNQHQWSWMYFNIGSQYKGWDTRFDAKLDKAYKKIYTYKGNKSKRFLTLQQFYEKKENNETRNSRK